MTKDEKIINTYKNMEKMASIARRFNLPRSALSTLEISDNNKHKVAKVCAEELSKAFIEIITCEGDNE